MLYWSGFQMVEAQTRNLFLLLQNTRQTILKISVLRFSAGNFTQGEE